MESILGERRSKIKGNKVGIYMHVCDFMWSAVRGSTGDKRRSCTRAGTNRSWEGFRWEVRSQSQPLSGGRT